jgi:hypothetical protein
MPPFFKEDNMSIASALVGRSVLGNKAMTWGTYTDSGAATADDVNTKLHLCEMFFIQPYGSSVAGNASVVNETLPVAGSAVTIRTDASQAGIWVAIGDMFA